MQVNLTIQDEAANKLEKLAKKTHRSKGAMVAYLVDRAWDMMKRRERLMRKPAVLAGVVDRALEMQESKS
jgi:predicted transcriptional regulator